MSTGLHTPGSEKEQFRVVTRDGAVLRERFDGWDVAAFYRDRHNDQRPQGGGFMRNQMVTLLRCPECGALDTDPPTDCEFCEEQGGQLEDCVYVDARVVSEELVLAGRLLDEARDRFVNQMNPLIEIQRAQDRIKRVLRMPTGSGPRHDHC